LECGATNNRRALHGARVAERLAGIFMEDSE
jgi:hypothetical protein